MPGSAIGHDQPSCYAGDRHQPFRVLRLHSQWACPKSSLIFRQMTKEDLRIPAILKLVRRWRLSVGLGPRLSAYQKDHYDEAETSPSRSFSRRSSFQPVHWSGSIYSTLPPPKPSAFETCHLQQRKSRQYCSAHLVGVTHNHIPKGSFSCPLLSCSSKRSKANRRITDFETRRSREMTFSSCACSTVKYIVKGTPFRSDPETDFAGIDFRTFLFFKRSLDTAPPFQSHERKLSKSLVNQRFTLWIVCSAGRATALTAITRLRITPLRFSAAERVCRAQARETYLLVFTCELTESPTHSWLASRTLFVDAASGVNRVLIATNDYRLSITRTP